MVIVIWEEDVFIALEFPKYAAAAANIHSALPLTVTQPLILALTQGNIYYNACVCVFRFAYDYFLKYEKYVCQALCFSTKISN